MEVSQLFFFDAEKIRSLAEDETSSQILGSAVKSLLGLDLAERLIADASVLETRMGKELEEGESRDGRAELDREIDSLGTELDVLRTTLGELENKRRRAADEVERLEEEFKAAGGKQWEARGKRKRRQETLKNEVTECEALLTEIAAKELPLCLDDDLIERVERQDEQERVSAELDVVRQILVERDERLLAFLDEVSIPRAAVQKVKGHLAGDRKTRTEASKAITARLALSPAARAQLQHLRGQRLTELRCEAELLVKRRLCLERESKEIERDLSITPEDDRIGQFLERLRATTERLAALNEEVKQIESVFAESKRDWDGRRARRQAISEREAKREFALDDRQRMTRIAGKTRTVMQEFLVRATERKISRLSDLITESFRFLLRKQTMVDRIHIDPASFAVTLYNAAGHALSRERLSEGEKQIFAISILWGLARASAHPLPAIIDTPMARLTGHTGEQPGRAVLSGCEPPGLDSFDGYRGRPAVLPCARAPHRTGVSSALR